MLFKTSTLFLLLIGYFCLKIILGIKYALHHLSVEIMITIVIALFLTNDKNLLFMCNDDDDHPWSLMNGNDVRALV